MDELIADLEKVTRRCVLDAMPADASGELEKMSLADLLLTYGNWRSRLIPQRPRRVHLSEELKDSPAAAEHRAGLDALVGKIEAGGNLKPHLSRAVEVAHQPAGVATSKLHLRKDRDLLVADWGVHHLHLSPTIEANGFVERADDLLFAVFTTDDAYLIDIYPHGSWALKEVLATLVRNWPDSDLMPAAMSGISLSQEYTDDERLELRKAGIAQAIEIDGTVYSPLGQTTAGTPIAVTMRVNALMWALREWRQSGEERLAEAARQIDERAGRSVTAEWRPVVHEDVCGLAREGFFVPIAQL